MSDRPIDVIQEQMETIRASAPAACELEDCYDLPTAVRVLLEFAWRAVSGNQTDEQANSQGVRG